MIYKEIKEYSRRKRINIVNSDGFKTGETVVLLSVSEYESLISQEKQFQDKDIEKFINLAVNSQKVMYDEQLKQYEEKLNDKDIAFKNMQKALTTLLINFNGLSLFDILIKKEHKHLISDIQDSIYINDVINAEIEKK